MEGKDEEATDMREGGELLVIRPSDFPGWEEHRAEADRQAAEGRRRYRELLTAALAGLEAEAGPELRADTVLDTLFKWTNHEGDSCHCSCHPQLPSSDHHDYGFDCSCRQSPEERSAWWDSWLAERDAYWDSPEGRREKAARDAERETLRAWVAAQAGVVVTEHGGMAPEQWRGSVDGHSFYFRERHDHWRIELDLQPTGQFHRVWKGGPLDDDESFELKPSRQGEVIAEGVPDGPGYGRTPVERAQMIVATIRDHLGRQACLVHTTERGDLETLFGRSLRWCPDCGSRLDGPQARYQE